MRTPTPQTKDANRKTWQFAFNSIDDLPELLVSGKEQPYLSWFYANKAVQLDFIPFPYPP